MFHLSRPAGKATPRRTKVIGHTSRLYPDEITEIDGIRLTTRERTWLDLAEMLNVDELVVIADQLIRVPRERFEGRSEPYCSKDDLQRMIDRHPGKRGIRKARQALDLARVGSDSPPETMLRLALVHAGLPEPCVNLRVVDEYGVEHHQPDLSYPELKIGIEYDGSGHAEQGQVDRDISRAEKAKAIEWTEVRISNRHMANEAKAAVAKVRSAMVARGWRPKS
ncbi:hypothetical protein GCM10027403_24320 [Arthrobacter tecti]